MIGASGGIGAAMAAVMAQDGYALTCFSRSEDGFDYADPDGCTAALDRLQGEFDVIFVATGALNVGAERPEKALGEISAEALAAQFAVNTIGPALVLRHAKRLLARDRRAVFAALSARVGSIGDNRLGGWYGYRASKAALNQLVHTGAVELARSHKQAVCVVLHPGTVDTTFTQNYQAQKHSPAEAAAHLWRVLNALTPAESGGFYDWKGDEIVW